MEIFAWFAAATQALCKLDLISEMELVDLWLAGWLVGRSLFSPKPICFFFALEMRILPKTRSQIDNTKFDIKNSSTFANG